MLTDYFCLLTSSLTSQLKLKVKVSEKPRSYKESPYLSDRVQSLPINEQEIGDCETIKESLICLELPKQTKCLKGMFISDLLSISKTPLFMIQQRLKTDLQDFFLVVLTVSMYA